MKTLRNFFAPPASTPAHRAYIALVARARNAFFYTKLGVPDTLDGRFELILLHLFFLQHRLLRDQQRPETVAFARELSEMFFADMDRSLREIGVADTGVRYRIKAMAKAYHGRLQGYTQAIGERDALRGALARNLYGTVEEGSPALLDAAADYAQAMVKALDAVDTDALISGHYGWPAL